MRKEEKQSYTAPKLLISNVTDLIENRYFEIVSTTNARMLSLFWGIGYALNKNQKNSNDINYLIDEKIAVSLSKSHLSLFSVENLRIMRSLAQQCTKTFLAKISPYISWKYIPYLLELDSEDEWISYIRLVIIEQLQPDQAKQRLLQTLNHDTRLKLKFPDHPFFDTVQPSGDYRPMIENYFNESETSLLRPILEPLNKPHVSSQVDSQKSAVEEDLVKYIISIVRNFQITHNSWLNIRFNLLFVDIGVRITEVFSKFNEPELNDGESVLNLSRYLEAKYGKLFNDDQLNKSIHLAKQLDDHIKRIEFAGLIRWDHILLLMPVEDIDEKLYYARLTAKEGLNAIQLKKMIMSNSYKQTSDIELDNKTHTMNSQKVKLEEHKTLIVDKVALNFENLMRESRVVQNIYENNYFGKFMLKF